jgi:hypothetical protein
LRGIAIPASVEVLGEGAFYWCKFLSSVIFESGSRLLRIWRRAFRRTDLMEIIIPASVGFLGEGCFSECKSLSSVRFESRSRLSRIKKNAFSKTVLKEISIPESTEFIALDAFFNCPCSRSQLSRKPLGFLEARRALLTSEARVPIV